ncbi:hypothetical protein LL270_00285 [Pseudomonas aestusnigri]|uniref:hypothetical protein n=1 Tax=Halopseudomonas aestusnigri TaxID=857252 RepID=UPI001D192FAE|nr:hypothetical protein [Halopseudomonas aestusnigri]MCC4259091.1 hypothetical protein [Halopseudomonas aestusnigri]
MSGEQFWVTVAIFTLGVLLIGGGFSRSQTPIGMALIWGGALCMLALVFYYIPRSVAL